MDPIRKIPKKFTKKFGNKVINRQYFCRKTGLKLLAAVVCFAELVLGPKCPKIVMIEKPLNKKLS